MPYCLHLNKDISSAVLFLFKTQWEFCASTKRRSFPYLTLLLALVVSDTPILVKEKNSLCYKIANCGLNTSKTQCSRCWRLIDYTTFRKIFRTDYCFMCSVLKSDQKTRNNTPISIRHLERRDMPKHNVCLVWLFTHFTRDFRNNNYTFQLHYLKEFSTF